MNHLRSACHGFQAARFSLVFEDLAFAIIQAATPAPALGPSQTWARDNKGTDSTGQVGTGQQQARRSKRKNRSKSQGDNGFVAFANDNIARTEQSQERGSRVSMPDTSESFRTPCFSRRAYCGVRAMASAFESALAAVGDPGEVVRC